MISLSLLPPCAASFTFSPSLISNIRPLHPWLRNKTSYQIPRRRRKRIGPCRAEVSLDAPFAAAIGACVLNSLVFPIVPSPEDENAESVIDSTDARFAVMGIISFIPYFNWLSWVFAWLDTGKRRYVVYAIVYLAPYLRSNMSLSPEDSWLPIASIVFCIIHIQLEASIRNGDIQGFQLFGEAVKYFPSGSGKREGHLKDHERTSKEERRIMDKMNLPPSEDRHRDEIQGWDVPERILQDPQLSNEDEGVDEGRTP